MMHSANKVPAAMTGIAMSPAMSAAIVIIPIILFLLIIFPTLFL